MISQRAGFTKQSLSLGFTLLEVVAVLVILGVIGVVAVSRFSDVDAKDLAEANTLKAHLRYAQLRAMGDIVPWGIELNESSYTLIRDGKVAPVFLPGEVDRDDKPGHTRELESGVIISSSLPKITFSSPRGIPRDEAGVDIAEDLTVSVGSKEITITAGTGFIP